MAAGQTIGSILGGAAGTLIAPGVGTSLGAAAGGAIGGQQGGAQQFGGSQAGNIAGGALGATQLLSGAIKKQKAEQLTPSLENPEQRALLEEVAAKRQSVQTGAVSATAIREAEQAGTTAQGNIARVTGGDVGGTVEALLKAQRGTQQAKNQALAAAEGQTRFFTGLQADLTNRISQRKLDLQQFQRVQALAEAAQARKEGISNLGAAFASSVPLGGQPEGFSVNRPGATGVESGDPNRVQGAGTASPPQSAGLNPQFSQLIDR